MKTAFLFAGQGSQHVGMGKDLYEEFPEFKEIFDCLPENLKEIAFNGPSEELVKTENTQPIMLAFALGVFKVLEKNGIRPDMAAGLSLGEYSALASAGVFDPKTAIELISFRGKEMAKASEGVACVMSAVLGLDRDVLAEIVAEASKLWKVEIANYNCPGQIVVSGTEEGVNVCEKLATEKGARRCMRLAVSGPFHTSYMLPAGEALEEKFKEITFNKMNFPVIFNCIGREKAADESIQELLVRQVSSSVYFEDSIKYMKEAGVEQIVEIGPGKVLSGFVKKTDRSIKLVNIETAEDIKALISE